MKRLFFVTGRPGIGKTTVLLNAAEGLKSMRYAVGGMISREVRHKGSRIGFELVDIGTNQKGWLAHTDQSGGPRVGKYGVNLKDLDSIGVKAIQSALKTARVIVIDEIGPMELFSEAFRQVVKEVAESQKLALGVVHYRTRDTVIDAIRKRSDAELVEVTMENRQSLHNLLIQKSIQFLDAKST